MIKVKALDHFDRGLGLPRYETIGSAGCDVKASFADKGKMLIPAGERVLIPTGLSFEIPEGFEIQVRPRSGLSLKTNLLVVNAPGTIDSDYRGEVKIIMGNMGDEDITIQHGDRIAQLVYSPVYQARFEWSDQLTTTARGSGGFGSTGINEERA